MKTANFKCLIKSARPLVLCGLLLVSGLMTQNVRGDIISELLLVAPGPAPGTFTIIYEVTLTDDQRLDPAVTGWIHFFTIYDFLGFIPGSQASTNPDFTPSSPPVGPTPAGVTPADSPAVTNISWAWTPAIPAPVIGPISLGFFSADSIFSTLKLDSYTGQATKNVPGDPADGTRTANLGEVEVPTGVVPEPVSLLLLGSGLLVVGFWSRRYPKQ